MRATALLLAAAALAACADKPAVPETTLSVVPVYCYRTLAVVDCHDEALRPPEHVRLVNHFGPPPPFRGSVGR